VSIHPLASVSADSQIGQDVSIGPFVVVESDVVIGDGCQLASHVVIKQGTRLGPGNIVHEGAVLGGLPQHIQRPERPGLLVVGSGNTIREHVTLHRAMKAGAETVLGDQNYLMAGSHIAHDCRLGNHVIFANDAVLGGHVTVDDRAFLSAGVGIHQFCRVGRLAMVGGHARIVQDVPPYVTIDGGTSCVVGLNLVGLRRAGLKSSDVVQLKAAYRLIYRRTLKWTEMLEQLKSEFPTGAAAAFHEFLSRGTRGFAQERRLPPGATLKLRDAQDGEAAEASEPAAPSQAIRRKFKAG
jgi:UDP-N-acetylglucosamine acyltransferase